MHELPTPKEIHDAAQVASAAISQIVNEFAKTYRVSVECIELHKMVINGDTPSTSYGAWLVVEKRDGVVVRE